MVDGNFAMTILLPIFWGVAAWHASRACRAPTKGKLYSRLRWSLIWTGISGLAFFVKATVVSLLGTSGWLFVEDKVTMQLPMVAIPAAAIVLFSIPAAKAIRAQRLKRQRNR